MWNVLLWIQYEVNLMEERKPALNLTVVKKQYRLGSIGGHTLQEDLQSWWAKLRKKENLI